jgi:flagellin-like protein
MYQSSLRTDDKAVSPVIGVVLMISITVMLAAATGSFILGMGDRIDQTTPQANFEFEYDESGHGNLTITHKSGDMLDPSRINVSVDEEFHPAPGNASGSPSGTAYNSLGLTERVSDGSGGTEPWVKNTIKTGTTFTIVSDSGTLASANVIVMYTAPSGQRTAALAEWDGPKR